jgi:hypothetical protein
MTSELKAFLIKHKDLLKLSTIEREAGISASTISLIINGYPHRSLSEVQENAINKMLHTHYKEVKRYLEKNYSQFK